MLKTRLEVLQAGALALAFACGAPQAFAQGALAAPAQQPAAISKDAQEKVGEEIVQRQASDATADDLVRKAVKAYTSGSYKEAVDYYLQARIALKSCGQDSDYVAKKTEECELSISKVYLAWAQKIASDAEKSASAGDVDNAIEQCNEAIKVYPPCKAKMEERIKSYTELKKTLEYRLETSEAAADPKKETRLYNIDVLLKQGKVFYDDGQWDQARDKYEEVLARDPYNSKAIDSLRKVNLRLLASGEQRQELVRRERMADAAVKDLTPLIPRNTAVGSRERISDDIIKEDNESSITRKLKNITIDHIEFEDVTVPTVIKYLKQKSKERDPEKVGVNIFLRLSTGEEPSPARQNTLENPALGLGMQPGLGMPPGMGPGGIGVEAAPAAAPVSTGADIKNTTITLSLDDVTLAEAISIICKTAKLKSRIERYAVVVASQDVPLDEVETRIYPLEKEALDIIGGDAADTVRDYFTRRGVDFPLGAKIVYDARISRLIVTNTPENLGKIEDIIREMNVIDPQVLVQAKFVEVNLNDFEELSFQYTIAKAGNNAFYSPSAQTNIYSGTGGNEIGKYYRYNTQTAQYYTNLDGSVVSAVGSGGDYPYPAPQNGISWDPNNNTGVRTAGNNPGSFGLNSSRPDQVFGYSKAAGQYYYNYQVHALDQSDSADVLSTPRVTTMNGQEAVIRMITEYYYPTDWSEATVSTSGNYSIFTASTPSFGEATDEGITLSVTPNVDADHYTITLKMQPSVKERTGWTDYSYSVVQSGTQYINALRMPEIEARTVDTTVSCYDGETIVLGGIIKDTTSDLNDGYPILCDLPLVGRMFQSQGKSSKKINLLMFLTCRLVNPDGSPIREREMRGLPPFRQ